MHILIPACWPLSPDSYSPSSWSPKRVSKDCGGLVKIAFLVGGFAYDTAPTFCGSGNPPHGVPCLVGDATVNPKCYKL